LRFSTSGHPRPPLHRHRRNQTTVLQIRDASGGESFAFNDLTPYNPPNTR
jgi:hypothetical protein